MALTITKLKMWKDPKYTQRCIEVPPTGSWKMPTPDYALAAGETLRPHKDSTLTSLELPLSFTKLFPMSYLYIEATDGNGSVKLFGWIENVTQIATSAEAVRIDWSVDWWRSFSGSATFGMGIVTRCNDATYKRPRTLLPRRRYAASYTKLFGARPDTDPFTMWVYVILETTVTRFVHNTQDVVDSTSYIEGIGWPSTNNQPVGPNNKHGMSMSSAYAGYMDEMILGWMATRDYQSGGFDYKYNFNIIAAYATPIKLSSGITWNGTYWTKNLTGPDIVEQGSYAFYINIYLTLTTTAYYSYTPATPLVADDTHQYVITDFDGNIAATIPWGTTLKTIVTFNDIGVAGGYLKISIRDTDSAATIKVTQGCEGRMITIPLPTIPVTSNYWSDYILTGQRDFNHLNREYSREEEAWKAGVSEAKTGIDKLASMDIFGAVLGAATGYGQIGANLMVNEAFADKYNKLDDMAAARQKNTIQVNGMSSFWQWMNMENPNNGVSGPYLVDMAMDSVSATEYSNEISVMGYETQIPSTSISSFITAGGPLQAKNVIVTGSIPPQAKQSIKTMLENGIYITENNPSGVVP